MRSGVVPVAGPKVALSGSSRSGCTNASASAKRANTGASSGASGCALKSPPSSTQASAVVALVVSM